VHEQEEKKVLGGGWDIITDIRRISQVIVPRFIAENAPLKAKVAPLNYKVQL
jgi:hypothetical protein